MSESKLGKEVKELGKAIIAIIVGAQILYCYKITPLGDYVFDVREFNKRFMKERS